MLHGVPGLLISQISSTVQPVVAAFNGNHSATQAVTNTLSSIPAGQLLILTNASANQSTDNPTGSITSSPVLTWTRLVHATASGTGGTEIWSAVFAAGGTITTTSTWLGSGNVLSGCLYSIYGNETTLQGASGSAIQQNNASVTVTTTKVNSILICVTSDFSAVDPSSRIYRRASTETFLDDQSGGGQYVGYHYYDKTITTKAGYTEGLTAPTSTAGMGTSVLEIRGI